MGCRYSVQGKGGCEAVQPSGVSKHVVENSASHAVGRRSMQRGPEAAYVTGLGLVKEGV